MCGIAGMWAEARGAAESARRMVVVLKNRGPDGHDLRVLDDGRLALGQARLAIIDLSPTGAQPMMRGADLCITYNGEIYNYKALRGELEAKGRRFESTSDTEVILAGYEQWGEAVLDHLDGIFAFALWDGRRRRLWLARDHLGVKPLYYLRDGSTFAFASEPRALLEILGRDPSPDRGAIHDYLSYGYIGGARSAFAGIAKLPGGHSLAFENGSVRIRRFWDPAQFAGERFCDESEAVLETRRVLDLSAAAQLESNVPVGLLVSGGIDSSAVTSSASRARAGMKGFVIGFDSPEHDEREFARLLAQGCGIDLVERVVAAGQGDALIGEMASAYDEPLADTSTLPCLALFRLVRENEFKVVLGGDGGDELFSGYRRYDRLADAEGGSQAPWPVKLVGAQNARQAFRIAMRPARYPGSAWRTYYQSIRLFSVEQQRSLLAPEWRPRDEDELTWQFRESWNDDLDTVKAAQLYDLQTYLPNDILTKVDRSSMYFGVEARVPLLSRQMVELSLGTSTRLHRRGGRRKNILKSAIRTRVPDALLSDRKRGFSLPLETTIGPKLREWAGGLASAAIARDGLIDSSRGVWTSANLDQLWALFVLESWWVRWLKRPATATAR